MKVQTEYKNCRQALYQKKMGEGEKGIDKPSPIESTPPL